LRSFSLLRLVRYRNRQFAEQNLNCLYQYNLTASFLNCEQICSLLRALELFHRGLCRKNLCKRVNPLVPILDKCHLFFFSICFLCLFLLKLSYYHFVNLCNSAYFYNMLVEFLNWYFVRQSIFYDFFSFFKHWNCNSFICFLPPVSTSAIIFTDPSLCVIILVWTIHFYLTFCWTYPAKPSGWRVAKVRLPLLQT